MKKLMLIGSMVAAAALATPAQAQSQAQENNEERRAAARQACIAEGRCPAPRRVYPWFFQGQDEGAQVRRPVRKLSLEL